MFIDNVAVELPLVSVFVHIVPRGPILKYLKETNFYNNNTRNFWKYIGILKQNVLHLYMNKLNIEIDSP